MSNVSDDVSSLCSNMSDMTVSCFGEDVPLEDAVDSIFKQIQEHINQMHCEIRNLCMAEDRNMDYEECFEYHMAIDEHVKQACTVFKELTKVSKQILPTKPKGFVDPRKRNLQPIAE